MELSTLLAHLELGSSNEDLLQVTLDCIEAFQANVIGVTAGQLMQIAGNEAYIAGDIFEDDRAEKEKEASEAEGRFRAVLGQKAPALEWRSTIGFLSLADYIARQARAADLIITSPAAARSIFDNTRVVDVGDLVMRAGRPVLIVPAGIKHLHFGTAVIAWKESREPRRAIVDALPVLQKVDRVIIVAVVDENDILDAKERVKDVAAWLLRHHIEAEACVVPPDGHDAKQIGAISLEYGADLLVAGAYGHNRLREWVLGGVTRDLLMRPDCCTFVSH